MLLLLLAKNFPNLEKETVTQLKNMLSPIQDVPKRNVPRHIVIKMTKIKGKEKILKQQGKSNT